MAGTATLKDNVRLYMAQEAITSESKVGNIASIGDIGGEAEEIDTTTIDSMAREFVNGYEDNGTIEITQNITNDEYTVMNGYKESGTEINWGIAFLNNAKNKQLLGLSGKGIVRSVRVTGISVGGLLQAVTSLRVSGTIGTQFKDPVLNPGA